MLIINGRQYPLWSQFVERKEEWIGGILRDDEAEISTQITDITLTANGPESAFFCIVGVDYDCGFDVRYGGISGVQGKPGWLVFSSYAGHLFRIKQKKEIG
jgi:hypothetical protein